MEDGTTRMRPAYGFVEQALRDLPSPDVQRVLTEIGYAGSVTFDHQARVIQGADALETFCTDILSNMGAAITKRLSDEIGVFGWLGKVLFPTVLADIMIALGLNPVVLAALTQIGITSYVIEGGPLDGCTVETDGDGHADGRKLHICTVDHPGRLFWEATWGCVIVTCSTVPMTVAQGLAGRPLRDVVTSPLTDLLDVRIASASADPGGLRLEFGEPLAKTTKTVHAIADSILQ